MRTSNFSHFEECLNGVRKMAVAAHVRPDGDAAGSCLAVYNYMTDNYPEIQVDVYLEPIAPDLVFLPGSDKICSDFEGKGVYDLFLVLDCGDEGRLGDAAQIYRNARTSACVDHHISNQGMGKFYVIDPEASATCELLFDLMDTDKISLNTATCLYTGIIHDTGVFQYSNTSRHTMEIGGILIGKGVPHTTIIDESFYQKTYHQNQILGKTLLDSIMVCDNKVIVGVVKQKEMDFYGVTPKDLDGIVSQLRYTKGVEVAVFLYETGIQQYKVSMRSNGRVNVADVAVYFHGGGHIRAAGCSMQGSLYDVINNLTEHIEKQLVSGQEDA